MIRPSIKPESELMQAVENPARPTSVSLPRRVAPGTFWFSTCLEVQDGGRVLHSHNSCFLVVGSKAAVLIDTAMPFGWPRLREEFAKALDGRKIDYLFPTHPESPHMGNLAPLLAQYPKATIVGDLRNYHLYHPEALHRCRDVAAGDVIDLGDRTLKFVPAIVHDLPNSLWAYDEKNRILFVSDAYPYTHDHEDGQCGMTSEELPAPIRPEDTATVISRALAWARHVDAGDIVKKLWRFLDENPVDIVCPAHGGVITNPREITTVFEQGLANARRRA
jgi:flavorubredoxin